MEKLDIKDTKEMLDFVMAVVQASVDAAADGKFGLGDIIRFCRVLPKLGPALRGSGNIRAELADLSEEEKKELGDLIQEKFKLENKLLEELVEQALIALISLIDLAPLVEEANKVKIA